MEVQAAFDTGPYLNVIECFVAEGSLLIFTCTKIHSAGKCPRWRAREWRGFGLGGRDAWEEVSCPAAALSFPFGRFERKGTPSPLSDPSVGGWKEEEKKESRRGWSWRGTSPGRGERMTVRGFRRFIHGQGAVMFEWQDLVVGLSLL